MDGPSLPIRRAAFIGVLSLVALSVRVAKGTDAAVLDACIAEVSALIEAQGKMPVPGEPEV